MFSCGRKVKTVAARKNMPTFSISNFPSKSKSGCGVAGPLECAPQPLLAHETPIKYLRIMVVFHFFNLVHADAGNHSDSRLHALIQRNPIAIDIRWAQRD